MGHRSGSDQVEFIRLNGTAIRATSWTETAPDNFRLVAIVRGAGEARSLADVLSSDTLELEVPGQDTRPVSITALDRRETGTAPAIITRFAVDFAPGGESSPASTSRPIDERVADLEEEVKILRALIEAIANNR